MGDPATGPTEEELAAIEFKANEFLRVYYGADVVSDRTRGAMDTSLAMIVRQLVAEVRRVRGERQRIDAAFVEEHGRWSKAAERWREQGNDEMRGHCLAIAVAIQDVCDVAGIPLAICQGELAEDARLRSLMLPPPKPGDEVKR